MKLAILGSGKMGGTLASLLSRKGYEVMIGSRDAVATEERFSSLPGIQAGSYEQAVEYADTIIIATPWQMTLDILSPLGDMKGKMLIDITNPLSADVSSLVVCSTSSAAEEIAKLKTEAHVVKAFNGINSANLSRPSFSGETVQVFYCGDSEQAKNICSEIIEKLGFAGKDCGALVNARWLETMAMLWIQLAFVEGYGMDFSFKMVQASAA
ncbi:hypothetical protein MNBD_GAMMA11-2998 [hydrothermal vent metagenome]|uniref:Pyrroline-5-carboxylate reductase catalytic N-terminal domain-containing protein n=1 Tax=hydrothermal vent metagenome TaxID=652676 RepID=A0A3B0X1K1_9ZZZZ